MVTKLERNTELRHRTRSSSIIQLFYAKLSMKFTMLINVKMPTIVGILTFLSGIIAASSEEFKAKNNKKKTLYFQHFTVLPAKSDSDVMFCLSYQGLIFDRSLVY